MIFNICTARKTHVPGLAFDYDCLLPFKMKVFHHAFFPFLFISSVFALPLLFGCAQRRSRREKIETFYKVRRAAFSKNLLKIKVKFGFLLKEMKIHVLDVSMVWSYNFWGCSALFAPSLLPLYLCAVSKTQQK